MSKPTSYISIKHSNTNSFGNGTETSENTTPSASNLQFKSSHLQKQPQSTPLATLTLAEFQSLDRKFSGATTSSNTTPNRLLKLQSRFDKKSKHIETIRHNVARKVQEHRELTAVIRNSKNKKASLHDSVNNINQLLKRPGMDIPRSLITRLMFEPTDYITRYNYPKCLDEFTTNLYKCSPEAYKLIQETFGNVLPDHSKI